MFRPVYQPQRPRVLIVADDQTTARRIVAALGRSCFPEELVHGPEGAVKPAVCDCGGNGTACCMVIGSIRQLKATGLDDRDVVIASTVLPDGTGVQALEHIHRVCPGLPVILVGQTGDAASAVAAIRAGAIEYLPLTGNELPSLPLAVEKCMAHVRMKQENARLQRDLGDSLDELGVKNKQLQAMIHQLEAMARTDELTRLNNRRWLGEVLERTWDEAVRVNRPLAFLMIDLDGFKAINDELGHQRGDDVLERTGAIIQANCRQVDTAARYGGDEFCVLMPECEAADAIQAARRILREYDHAYSFRRQGDPQVGMSIGVAHIDVSRPADRDELIRHADEALYAAKSAGKHQVMIRNLDGHCTPVPLHGTDERSPAASA